jgi:hypothetical protein
MEIVKKRIKVKATTNKKKHVTRDQVIKTNLDMMMK